MNRFLRSGRFQCNLEDAAQHQEHVLGGECAPGPGTERERQRTPRVVDRKVRDPAADHVVPVGTGYAGPRTVRIETKREMRLEIAQPPADATTGIEGSPLVATLFRILPGILAQSRRQVNDAHDAAQIVDQGPFDGTDEALLCGPLGAVTGGLHELQTNSRPRSEERRVGKECRSRWTR